MLRTRILLVVLGLVILTSCQASNELSPPFSNIIPSCQNNESTPNLWFENTKMGEFHAENNVVELYERSCKGQDVKMWMIVMVFDNDEDAKSYIQKQSSQDYLSWTTNELPNIVKSQPDQFVVFGINNDPSFIEGDDDEHGALTEGVLFRVGRYVGDYSITRSFPFVEAYFEWKDIHGVGFSCWNDLYSAVDSTIFNLRMEFK